MKLISPLLAATALFLNGCATSKLWEADHFAKYGEPAPDAKLQLFQSDQKRDVLVEYDELPPGRGDIRRRAYFLHEDESKARSSGRPKFVVRPAMEGLRPIDILLQEPQAGKEPGYHLYAVASTNGHKFTLFSPDNRLGLSYELPVYRASSGRLTQVFLTPPALVADATIVGGVLIVLLWPSGYSFSP